MDDVPSAGSESAERRHLSVLFCDVADSTPISERLDPEDFREVLRIFQQGVADAVRVHDGAIAQYIGDGVVAYFGMPSAHEDAACRAVRAGLELLTRLEQSNTTLERRFGLRLRVRVGVHSGVVVLGRLGDGTSPAHGAIGDTMHLASRLCGQAVPGQLLVTEATHRLLAGSFVTEPAGRLELRGFSHPVAAYRVTAVREDGRPLGVRARARLTPFVDRDAELGMLCARWATARDGHGQVVLLDGEAGIGKSRLVRAFRERLAGESYLGFATDCSPYRRTSPLHPILDVLAGALDLAGRRTPGQKLARLERVLGPFLSDVPDAIPLLAALLDIECGDAHPLPPMSPQRQRRQTLEVLLALMFATARIQPVLIVVDDLHWADPSTLELLETFVEQTANARLLTVLVHRPEFVPAWRPHAHVTRLTLGPMPHAAIATVVRGSVEAGALAGSTVDVVAKRSEGNPLFAEELARMIAEAGADGADGIPATLRDWLAARLDRLGAAKTVAQIAATIGRTFSYRALRAIVPMEESVLLKGLARLTAAELIQPRGLPPRATYTFKHVLIQEAAYESLLHSERRRYHLALAQMLEDGPVDAVEAEPELIAHHYGEAGCAATAIALWGRAADRAVARSANAEAVAHLRRGLELAEQLGDTTARAKHELALLASLAMPLALRQGYAAPEVEAVFLRARELALALGNSPYLFGVVRGMLGLYEVSGRYERAAAFAAELDRLAAESGEAAWAVEAAWEQGSVALFTGRLAEARRHLDRALALYDPAAHRANAYLFGEDPGMMAHVHAALACWLAGDADTAVGHIDAGIRLGEEVQHPNSIAMALCFAAAVHLERGDVARTVAHAEAALRLATDQEFPLWIGLATVHLGWAAACEGRGPEGIERMRAGIAQWRATGAEEAIPALLALVADALLRLGRADEATATLVEAQEVADRNGERFYEPELHRLAAEALRARGGAGGEVERRFQQALEVARACGARALELRAALGLARLWRDGARGDDARALVRVVASGLTEGTDTRDVREARAFLGGAS
jgi:class 3 adenylate cyclase/predicted ATPase